MRDYLNLREGDFIMDKEITKTTDKSCWLDGKRYAWGTIGEMIANGGKIYTKHNLDIVIDWTDKQVVLDYYNSFKEWCFYIAMGDVKDKALLVEVKDGMAFHDNEYWLPGPISSFTSPNGKRETEDGWYYVNLIKKSNSWFGNEVNHTSNVMCIHSKVNINPTIEDIKKIHINTDRIICYPYDGDFRVDYTQSSRHGLSIDRLYIHDFVKFFKRTCLPKGNEQIVIPDEIMTQIKMDGGKNFWGIESKINNVLNDALNSSSYHIEDDDSWGEYSLRYVEINKEYCEKVYNVIRDTIKNL